MNYVLFAKYSQQKLDMMSETVAFDSLSYIWSRVSKLLWETKNYLHWKRTFSKQLIYSKRFFRYNKHLLDLTSSNIQLIAPVQNNIGRSKRSPEIILSGYNWRPTHTMRF